MHRLKVSYFTWFTIYIILIFEDLRTAAVVTKGCHECLVPRTNLILTVNEIPLQPGSMVSYNTSVNYYCLPNYILEGVTENVCNDGWLQKHPECRKMCPPIQGHTIEATCIYKEEKVDCEKYVKSGTSARINCASMYTLPKGNLVSQDLICENDGEWNFPQFRCEQICGTTVPNAQFSALTLSGTLPSKVPWHVAIYSNLDSDKYKHICAGTLIQSKIVISAAHCFWDSSKSIIHDISKFVITVGKFYRDYYADNETLPFQRINISKIDIPYRFNGTDYNFNSDIAVISLQDNVKYENHILPACLTWKQQSDEYIPSGVGGVVSGWSIENPWSFSSVLRSIKLFSVDINTCKMKKMKMDNKLGGDKFCAQSYYGANVCGDSGGGFLVPETIGSVTYYNMWGVVSSGVVLKSDGTAMCDTNFIATITNVQYYKQLINDAIADAYSVEFNATNANKTTPWCIVPTKNLIFTDTTTKSELLAGVVVAQFTSVDYSCPSRYVLKGATNNVCDVYWKNAHPKCLKMCSPMQGHTIEAYCEFNGEKVNCNEYVKPGTIARISCAISYKKPSDDLIYQNLQCEENGKWSDEPFTCEQICGTIDNNVPFSINSEITKPSKVPWHVAIYAKTKHNKYVQICGGTLIHSKVVISAAHCFWDPSYSVPQDKSKFIIAVGKSYRDFYVSNETLEVQISNLTKIDIPVTFLGANYDYSNDIAVLTLENHINYKSHIRPACLSWKSITDRNIESNRTGVVAGWGITDTGTYSPDLRSVELLSIDSNTCKTKKIRKNDNIAGDKFCVETSTGKNVCQGDSGGGYVVAENIDSALYYQLWGVVSNGIISASDGIPECTADFITTFTNVQFHRQLISDAILNAYKK